MDASAWSLAAAQAWQIAALVAVIVVVSRLLGRRRPHLAHALWLVVLLKCVTPPIWSSPTSVFSWLRYAGEESAADNDPAHEAIADRLATSGADIAGTGRASATGMPAAVVIASTNRHGLANQVVGSVDTSHPAVFANRFDAGIVALTAWIGGMFLVIIVAVVRLLLCWRLVRRCGVRRDVALDELLAALSCRLGLRRKVKMLVTESHVGPAVIGLFRPTILLPACVMAGRTPDELEPILAHELIHVRRGDLWVGLLEIMARAVWWFHPLVWLAGRAISREAERCCDEEVVTGTGCDPVRYARSLLDVLELKRKLVAVPAFPGVRPVELTSQRLERIMSLRQGCRPQARWCYRLVMLSIAALALPGAALVVAATDQEQQSAATGEAAAAELVRRGAALADARVRIPYHEGSSPEASRETSREIPNSWITKDYDAADLVAAFCRSHEVSDEIARKLIVSETTGVLAMDRQFGLFGRETFVAEPSEPTEPQFTWSDNTLRVLYSPAGHRRVALALADLRQREYTSQIGVQVGWVSLGGNEKKLFDVFGHDWQLMPSALADQDDVAPVDDIFPRFDDSAGTHASLSVRRNFPVLCSLINSAQVQSGLDRLAYDAKRHWISAPKVTTFGGQTAVIIDIEQTPFVVGLHDVPGEGRKPVIRVCNSGTALRLKAKKHDDVVHLDYEFVYSSIGKVDTFRLPTDDGATLQVPEVARTHFQSSVDLPLNKTLAISGLGRVTDKGITDQIVVLVTAQIVCDGPVPKVGDPPAEASRDQQSAAEPAKAETSPVDQPEARPSDTGQAGSKGQLEDHGDQQKVIYETQFGARGDGRNRSLVVHDGLAIAVDDAGDKPVEVPAKEVQPVVAEIRIEGDTTLVAESITPLVKTRAGEPLDAAIVAEDVARLTKTHRFVSVESRYEPAPDGRTIVVFHVVERPKIRYVKIEPSILAGSVPVPGLKGKLEQQTRLNVGERLDPEKVEEARARLEDYLHSIGSLNRTWAGAKVTTLEGMKPDHQGVRFLIAPGEQRDRHKANAANAVSSDLVDEEPARPDSAAAPHVRAQQVGFALMIKGAKDAKPNADGKSTAALSLTFEGEPDEAKIRDQAQRLTDYYRSLGYFKAQVAPLSSQQPGKEDQWLIKFIIDEGPRFTVTGTSFIGCKAFTAEELVEQMATKAGARFDQGRLKQDIAAIKAYYAAADLSEPAVVVEERFPEVQGTVQLVFKIAEDNPSPAGPRPAAASQQ